MWRILLASILMVVGTLQPAISRAEDYIGVSLSPSDLPPGFVLAGEDFGINGPNYAYFALLTQQNPATAPGPLSVKNSIVVSLTRDMVSDAIFDILLTEADPGGRNAPREFPGPLIGDGARWFRVTEVQGPLVLDTFSVIFRRGLHAAYVGMTTEAGHSNQFDLATYAEIVDSRLALLIPE